VFSTHTQYSAAFPSLTKATEMLIVSEIQIDCTSTIAAFNGSHPGTTNQTFACRGSIKVNNSASGNKVGIAVVLPVLIILLCVCRK
jgi:hypothetical protein